MKKFLLSSYIFTLLTSCVYGEIPIIADEERATMVAQSAQTHHVKTISKENAECLTQEALKERNIDITKYDKLSVEEIAWSDTKVWFIIFQLKKEFRVDPKKTGGEIFVSIDQNTSEVAVTYAGCPDSYQ